MLKINFGKYKNKKIITSNLEYRPTKKVVKESIINIVNIEDNFVMLDLFAGTGQIGFEFLSKGVEKVYFVDIDKIAVKNIIKTINTLDKKEKEKILVFNTSFKRALKKIKEKIDIIYLDPPYNDLTYYEEALKLIEKNNLLKKNGVIIVELMKKSNIDLLDFKLLKERRYGNTKIFVLTK